MGQYLQKYQDDFILFCEAGFIATNQADEDSALKLFKASEMFQPENTLPQVGIGYMYMLQLQLNQACQRFENVLKSEPTNGMAKALLGLSYVLTTDKVDRGEQILEEATKHKDEQVKRLASDAIVFAETCVKKAPTPAQAPTEKKKKKK